MLTLAAQPRAALVERDELGGNEQVSSWRQVKAPRGAAAGELSLQLTITAHQSSQTTPKSNRSEISRRSIHGMGRSRET